MLYNSGIKSSVILRKKFTLFIGIHDKLKVVEMSKVDMKNRKTIEKDF